LSLGEVRLQNYQDRFVFSEKRFPCLIAAVGTGKTMALLLKAWLHCEQNEGALALMVRREYTDLRDSTIKDFEAYFGVKIHTQDKEYTFPNGSKIMFRHGDVADINVLKNINLSFIGIEQAEEYEVASVFDFLRDRLRRKIKGTRQMAVIANARGHNWMWQRWIQRAEEVETIKEEHGVRVYTNGEYECTTANSFANAEHLPPDFVADLRAKKEDAPNQYSQYVLNSFEDVDEDDYLITQDDETISRGLEFIFTPSGRDRVLGVDIARYGMDSCVAVLLERCGPDHWDTVQCEVWKKKDTMETTGRIIEIMGRYRPSVSVIDGDGLGVGAVDRIREIQGGSERSALDGFSNTIIEFRGGSVDGIDRPRYVNLKAMEYFTVKEMMQARKLRIREDMIMTSLRTVKYKFMSNGKRAIVTKEEMKKKGLKSPDEADAMMMAVHGIRHVHENNARSVAHGQSYAIMSSGPISLSKRRR
jgi:hypothetical protein